MQAVLYDTIESLHHWGFTRVFLVNGHGDPEHEKTILDTVKQVRHELGSE